LAADFQEQAVDYDSVEFSGRFRDGRGTFALHVVCDEGSGGALPKAKFLGVDTGVPTCVVRVLTFSVNGKDVSLPPKSYADLANVSIGGGVYVTTQGSLVVLHLHGGDGETAYKTRYLIKDRALITREVEELGPDGELSIRKEAYGTSQTDKVHKEH
jgi:hypothetical protein